MKKNFYFKKISENDKKIVKEYTEKQFKKIEKLLHAKDHEVAIANINCEFHQKHNCYTTSVTVELPFSKLHAEEDSHDVKKTLDEIFDKLLPQFKKQKSRIRKENKKKKVKITKVVEE